mmetsp:Transcript_13620/g.39300  ORF Transcript_13620/g.39300 Transcript_13620/m.39300 type:complete len:310 (-) Transcript_13620:663-1592(-)
MEEHAEDLQGDRLQRPVGRRPTLLLDLAQRRALGDQHRELLRAHGQALVPFAHLLDADLDARRARRRLSQPHPPQATVGVCHDALVAPRLGGQARHAEIAPIGVESEVDAPRPQGPRFGDGLRNLVGLVEVVGVAADILRVGLVLDAVRIPQGGADHLAVAPLANGVAVRVKHDLHSLLVTPWPGWPDQPREELVQLPRPPTLLALPRVAALRRGDALACGLELGLQAAAVEVGARDARVHPVAQHQAVLRVVPHSELRVLRRVGELPQQLGALRPSDEAVEVAVHQAVLGRHAVAPHVPWVLRRVQAP